MASPTVVVGDGRLLRRLLRRARELRNVVFVLEASLEAEVSEAGHG